MDERALALRIASLPSAKAVEEVLAVMNDVERFQIKAREIKGQLDAALIAYIDEHGEIELGDKRWYVGNETDYKQRTDIETTVSAILEVTGGDLSAFCSLLASDALKPGACKKALGDRFGELFEAVKKPDLKTGKPKRIVKVADQRFSK